MLVEYTEQDLPEPKNNISDICRQPTDLSVPRTSIEGSFHRMKESVSQNKQCRICLDDEAEAPDKLLICPCKCSGSIKYVHECCMRKWLASAIAIKTSQQRIAIQRSKGIQCEMCKDTIIFSLSYQHNCRTYNEVLNTIHQKQMLSVVFLILIVVALIGIGFAAYSISKGEQEFVGKDGVNLDFVLAFSGIILLVFFVVMALYAFVVEFFVKKTLLIGQIGEQSRLSRKRPSSNSNSNQISNVWE